MTVTQQPSVANHEPGAAAGPAHRSLVSRALLRQEFTLALVIVVISVAAFTRNHAFLSSDNVLELLRSSVIYFVMACGAALLTIGGGLDFSVGGVFTLGALSTTLLLVRDVPWPLAVVFGIVIGALVGAINHLVITYLHVPPIIATLGTFFILLGLDTQVSQGDDVLPLPEAFTTLGQGSVLGIPNVILYAIAVGVVCWFLLERTRFGVNVRALGGNRQAAVQNGLRVARLDLALYAIAGATGALAGIIYAARVGAGQVQAGGATTTLNVVTAVLIGGVSLFGGLGSITGVAFGALLLSTVDNALIVAQVPPDYNNIIVGAILIGAVAVDHLRRKRLYRRG
ncbi:ABC transporter permease [Hamadaea sp. NPDC051192]|uniref:ABC transporter permease n=1 Tax=Hamadaea sp. NPDC051192 TaxID=3154940 RepID=UPI00341B6584